VYDFTFDFAYGFEIPLMMTISDKNSIDDKNKTQTNNNINMINNTTKNVYTYVIVRTYQYRDYIPVSNTITLSGLCIATPEPVLCSVRRN